MRRQTVLGGVAVEGTRDNGLDPFALPVSLVLPLAGKPPGAATAATVDRDSIFLTGPSGPTLVRLDGYRGVGVRINVEANGTPSAVLELNHPDRSLCLPLRVVDDPAEIAADWQAWSRSLRLPMLLIEADGSVSQPIERPGAVMQLASKPRRMHSYFASRRPRFLTRRKTGWRRDSEIVSGAEIIARD